MIEFSTVSKKTGNRIYKYCIENIDVEPEIGMILYSQDPDYTLPKKYCYFEITGIYFEDNDMYMGVDYYYNDDSFFNGMLGYYEFMPRDYMYYNIVDYARELEIHNIA